MRASHFIYKIQTKKSIRLHHIDVYFVALLNFKSNYYKAIDLEHRPTHHEINGKNIELKDFFQAF